MSFKRWVGFGRWMGRQWAAGLLVLAMSVCMAGEGRALRVGLGEDLPPVAFVNAEGAPDGLYVDLWRRYSALTGQPVEFVTDRWQGIKQRLLDGEVDLVFGMPKAEREADRLEFSPQPFSDLNLRLYFHESLSGITDAESTRGVLVGVREGGVCQKLLVDAGSNNLRAYANNAALLQAAFSNEVRVFCAADQQAHYLLERSGRQKEFRQSPPLLNIPLHWAVRRGDMVHYREIEAGLARIPATEMQELKEKWFGAPIAPSLMAARFRHVGLGLVTLLALAVLLALWNYALRTRVREKTEALSRALESLQASQNEILAAHENLAATFEVIPDFFAEFEEGGLCLEARSGRATVTYPRPADYIGRNYHDFLLPEAVATVEAAFARAIEQGADYGAVIPTRRHGESGVETHWLELSVARKTPVGVRPARLVLIARDVTDRYSAQLAQRAAELASEAKSSFLANMSHEIRTPLNAVIATALLMQQEASDSRQLERLARITSASQHLLHLINDILDYAKIESGKITLEERDFDLHQVLDLVSSQVGEQARSKGLAWRLSVAPEVPRWLKGDSLRLGQVLLNLTGNATKFTRQGEVALSIHVCGGQGEQCRLRFEVRDTGCGFDAATEARLFRPFEQADDSTTREFGGTGLGLAICRDIVMLMGGEIGAHSAPGVGSTFWFEARFAPGHKGASPAPAGSLRGRRALLLADSPPPSPLFADHLAALGVSLQQVRTPSEAVLRVETAHRVGRPYSFLFCMADGHLMEGLAAPELQARLYDAQLSVRPRSILLSDMLQPFSNGQRSSLECFATVVPENLPQAELETVLHDVLNQAFPAVETNVRTAGSPPRLAGHAQARLLLVEDNPVNQEVALDLLRTAGLTADVADNGREALAMAENRQYDLILMDVQMPVMNGLEATAALRRMVTYRETPILAMTANAFEADRSRCMAAGMSDFLGKPVTPDGLYAALARWLPAPSHASDGGGEAAHAAGPAVHTPDADKHPASVATAGPAVNALETSNLQTGPTLSGGASGVVAGAFAASDAQVTLPEYAGLNVEYGLATLSGKRGRYRELLQHLYRYHVGDPQRIRAHLARGEVADGRRLAHSLKGSAAMLGAHEISHAALAVEKALATDPLPDDLEARIDVLAVALANLGDGLQEH